MEVPGVPAAVTPEASVADLLRANIAKAQQAKGRQEDFAFPPAEGLFITFRPLDDYTELQQIFATTDSTLPEGVQEIQAAINTLVASSVDSYAIVDGERHDVGLKLGVELYQRFWPQNGVSPTTDGEAVALMFGNDTVGLVMFARRLNVWRKIQQMLVEADPGKS